MRITLKTRTNRTIRIMRSERMDLVAFPKCANDCCWSSCRNMTPSRLKYPGKTAKKSMMLKVLVANSATLSQA